MDPSWGYNRSARKLLHILGGIPALALPFVPYWAALVVVTLGVVLAYSLKPAHAWWLRYISKPADRHRKVITGFRCYATVVFLLVALWPLLELATSDAVNFIMLGWLALAFGDGLAGLIGPSPRRAPTVPWNKHKTWWGLCGCFVGTFCAYILSFGVPLSTHHAAGLGTLVTIGLVLSAAAALLESIKIKLDDNFLVGLGVPLLALATHLLTA